MTNNKYKIIHFGQNRYAISDLDGKIIDDANGHGYKTSKNAYLAMNYKYLGGKQKKYSQKNNFNKWIKSDVIHKKIISDFNNCLLNSFKEISRGETNIDEIWKSLQEEYNIIIPDFVKKQATN